ncbi:MAG: chromosomal replication initiator protein DnaA [Nitrospinota bacterium]
MISIWQQCKAELKKRISDHLYDIWIEPVGLISDDNCLVRLSVPNEYHLDKLNKEYLPIINLIYKEITGEDIKFAVSVRQDSRPEEEHQADCPVNNEPNEDLLTPDNEGSQKTALRRRGNSGLNPKYRFSNFIVGSCNEFARAAAEVVAKNPGETYNPLFIYGGVGLGKTHLMQAIGNYILKKDKTKNVIYLTTEAFINDLITSLQKNKMAAFRERYRKIDTLIMDDIHFIAGKERSQEEFFHTFNALFESTKQIIISSDKFPREIPKLEGRLRSRFESGLITDIKPPAFETRVAILNQKASEVKTVLPPEVAECIASRIKTNIRELEGALSHLVFVSSFSGCDISLKMAEDMFKEIYNNVKKNVEISDIQKATCELFNINISLIKSKKRDRGIMIPRQVAMYLCKKLTNYSLADIGKKFGGKDHSTVIHSCKKIEEKIKEDNELASYIKEIEKNLEL